MQEAKQNKL